MGRLAPEAFPVPTQGGLPGRVFRTAFHGFVVVSGGVASMMTFVVDLPIGPRIACNIARGVLRTGSGSSGEVRPGGPRAGHHFAWMQAQTLRRHESLRNTRGTHAELMKIWTRDPPRENGGDDASCLAGGKDAASRSRRPKGSQWQECSNYLLTRNQPSGSG